MSKQHYPEPSVGALIINPNGELFLMKSHKWRDKYQVPGGHIELGENMETALHREIKEETNLDIHDIEFLVFQEFIYDDAFWKPGHYIFFDFACKTNATDVILNEEAQSYIWIEPEEALKMDIDQYTKNAIEKYLQKQECNFSKEMRS